MKYVNFPNDEIRRLSYYLSTEEYIARAYPEGEYFFMWQVEPTVIFGRNQLIENEVNLEYVKRNNIHYYRRKSGGGCVYSDFSNIMFAFITPSFNKDFVFDEYLTRVIAALQTVGIEAVKSGRNDLLYNGKKISGNAFYRIGNRSVVHGTMLFDTDLSVMVKAITPDNEKLISKGVESVRQRVTNLKEYLTIDIEEFKKAMKKSLTDSEMTLTKQDLHNIAEIEKEYLDPAFIYGKNPSFTLTKKGRTNAGMIEAVFELKNNTVKQMNLLGDYFLIEDLDPFIHSFFGVEFTRDAFSRVLETQKIGDVIYQLTNDDLLKLLFEE